MKIRLRIGSIGTWVWAASARAMCALSCTPTPEPPNVLVVLWDTARADRLSAYGYSKPTTPYLETWLRESLWFSDAISTASSTLPSHASIFTGLLPIEHGTYGRFLSLDTDLTTLAEQFQLAGYATYLYAANVNLARESTFHQGFDRVDHPFTTEARPRAQKIVQNKLATGGADAPPAVNSHSRPCSAGWQSANPIAPTSHS